MNSEILIFFVIVYYLLKNLFIDEEYYRFFKITDVNFWIILLIFILYLIILSVEISFKLSLNLLFLVLIYLIWVSNFIIFFFFYEIIFILIIFVIILLGYSYERLLAAYLIIFYSFLFSSPIIILFLIFDNVFLFKFWLNYSRVISYFLIGSFIVKFPIFGFHYWLPVAHVEASTIGSILLAGILLKLGSIGLLYVIMYLKFIIKFHWLSIRVLIVILLILFLSDLKIIIAYSSIAHISIVFYVIIIGSLIAKKGALLIIFYHGILSPLIFWLVGLLRWWKTRSLFVVKFISFSYIFFILIFFLAILNISFPPFIGFISEILILKALVISPLIIFIIVLGVLFRCYYNIYFFWSFSNFIGLLFKVNLYRIDVFIFLIWVLFLNF